MRAHARANPHTHTHVHKHRQTRTHARTQARTHAHTDACRHARTHARTQGSAWKDGSLRVGDYILQVAATAAAVIYSSARIAAAGLAAQGCSSSACSLASLVGPDEGIVHVGNQPWRGRGVRMGEGQGERGRE